MKRPLDRSKSTLLMGAFLLLGALLLRLYGAIQFPLSFDELIQYDILSQTDLGELLLYLQKNDRQLPLQYLFVYPLLKAGLKSLFWLRLPSLLFSFSGLLFFIFHCKRTLGAKNALWGGIFLGFNYLALEFSTSMRPYALLLMLSCLAQYLFETFRQRGGKGLKRGFYLALMGSFLGLSLTHYYGALLASILGLWCLIILAREKREHPRSPFFPRLFLGAFILIGVGLWGYSALEPVYPHPNHHFPGIEKILYTPFILLGSWGLFLSSLFFLLIEMVKRRTFFGCEAAIVVTFLGPLFALLISWLYHPAYEYRFFVIGIPWGLWLGLKATSRLHGLWRIAFLAALFVDVGSFSLLRKDFLAAKERISFQKLKEERPDLREERILFCGNCPSYYFPDGNYSCKSGWNFKEGPTAQEGFDYLIVFDQNKVFCDQFVRKEWQKTFFPGLHIYKIYDSSSTSSKY